MAELSALGERRNEMLEFIKNNTVSRKKPLQIDRSFYISSFASIDNLLLHTISGQQEFYDIVGFEEINNPFKIDTDKEELLNLTKNTIDYIVSENHDKVYPGFIFLQAETDYTQTSLFKRFDKIVNKQGGNKQALGRKNDPKPFLDKRTLTKPELVVWSINQNQKGYNKDLRYSNYFKDLLYYNVNKHIVEEVSFLNWDDYKDYKKYQDKKYCPQCKKPDGFNHFMCKSNLKNNYTAYVIERDKVRYQKRVAIGKKRAERIIASTSIKHGLRFRKYEIRKSFLEAWGSNPNLPLEKYYVTKLK